MSRSGGTVVFLSSFNNSFFWDPAGGFWDGDAAILHSEFPPGFEKRIESSLHSASANG